MLDNILTKFSLDKCCYFDIVSQASELDLALVDYSYVYGIICCWLLNIK